MSLRLLSLVIHSDTQLSSRSAPTPLGGGPGGEGARQALATARSGTCVCDRRESLTGRPHGLLTHTRTRHTHERALPPNEDAVVSSSISSVLESSELLPPAKGGEVTGGASGRPGCKDTAWGPRGENSSQLHRQTPCAPCARKPRKPQPRLSWYVKRIFLDFEEDQKQPPGSHQDFTSGRTLGALGRLPSCR